MESVRASPTACRMTDERADKLIAAKMKRSERKRNPSMQINSTHRAAHRSLMIEDASYADESRYASTQRVRWVNADFIKQLYSKLNSSV